MKQLNDFEKFLIEETYEDNGKRFIKEKENDIKKIADEIAKLRSKLLGNAKPLEEKSTNKNIWEIE